MASTSSNTSNPEILEDTFRQQPKEEKPKDCQASSSTVQPHTQADETDVKSYIATEDRPIHIENNSHIVNITACGKCSNSDTSQTSDVTALSNQVSNVNINIGRNFGIVIISLASKVYNVDLKPNSTVGDQQSVRTLSDYNIQHESTVHLVMRLRGGRQEVFVKTLTGKTITIGCEPSTTILDIKVGICDREGIPVDQQRLIYKGNELKDEAATLKYYDIEGWATIHLLVLRLRDRRGAMQVYVKTLTGKTITIECYPTTTIGNLKVQICDKEGIPADQQRLVYKKNELKDEAAKLKSYDIGNQATIHLDRRGAMQVYVKTLTGKTITIECDPTTTIGNFKAQICDKEGIRADQQRLVYMENELKDEAATLKCYNIGNEATIYLTLGLRFHNLFDPTVDDPIISGAGRVYSLLVQPNSTIEEIKSKVQDKEGIPTEQQRLIFEKKQLKDGRTLSDYNVRNGSRIYLVSRPRGEIKVYVKTLAGKVFTIECEPSTTISDFKEKICDEEGIPADQYRLLFDGNQLADEVYPLAAILEIVRGK